ncbi:MAG: PD40 domain-containing protein [Burkholderiales bacterium]|nr:PD40 domain-containing protein [Opitutaceae bacterium]
MFTRFSPRFKSLHLFVLSALAAAALVTSKACAQTGNNLGDVVITTTLKNTPILVTGSTPELNKLANDAFTVHGAFRRQAQGYAFKVDFSPAGAANQVQVTVQRARSASVSGAGGQSTSNTQLTPVLSQVVAGNSPRNALFKAADVAVKAMTGKPGFFASKLAFIGERTGKPEVYVGDLFLGDVRQITNDKALALTPRWSPDGQRLLYTSYFRTGFPDIFSLDLGSLQRNTFVSFKGTNSGARFSPDGKNVAMVLSGEGNSEIYVGNAQGRQITRKTRTSAVEASPCWSPDGSRLIFTSDAQGGPLLYIMPAAGGAAQRLPTRISGYCAEPDWSKADANKIAFTIRIGKGFQIAMYDFSTGVAKQVSKQPADAVEPSWLADGRHLVFSSRSAGASSLWILDTENQKATQLSAGAAGKVSQASVLDPR